MSQASTASTDTPFRRRSLLCIPLLALGLGGVVSLMHFGGSISNSFHHLFYIVILAGAYCFGLAGGVSVALAAGVLGSHLFPFIPPAVVPGDHLDCLVRLVAYVLVGGVTGSLATTLYRRLDELNQMTDDSIRAFIRALDAIDGATARHSENVAEYATAIAKQMRLTPAQIDRVRWAALLHDVGKLSVPIDILTKEGPLDEEEWAIVRRHPLESVRIVRDVTRLHGVLAAVRHHHERVDGRGYPDGVQGVQFPLEARIISVADAFDAMTSDRPYRRALSVEEAYAELRSNVGSQFDSRVVAAFIATHSRHLGGGTGPSEGNGTESKRCRGVPIMA